MAVLTQPRSYPCKHAADPLFFVGLTNQHATFREVVGNFLILAFAGEEGGQNQGNII